MNITCAPLGHGRYAVRLGDRLLIKSTDTPFFDGARVLRAEGVAVDEPLTMTHEGSRTVSLRSTVGIAAGLAVVENATKGPKLARHRVLPATLRQVTPRVALPAAERAAPAPV